MNTRLKIFLQAFLLPAIAFLGIKYLYPKLPNLDVLKTYQLTASLILGLVLVSLLLLRFTVFQLLDWDLPRLSARIAFLSMVPALFFFIIYIQNYRENTFSCEKYPQIRFVQGNVQTDMGQSLLKDYYEATKETFDDLKTSTGKCAALQELFIWNSSDLWTGDSIKRNEERLLHFLVFALVCLMTSLFFFLEAQAVWIGDKTDSLKVEAAKPKSTSLHVTRSSDSVQESMLSDTPGQLEAKFRVFIAADRVDIDFEKQLRQHLAVLNRNYALRIESSNSLLVGAEITPRRERVLEQADLIVILASASYVYNHSEELKSILQRQPPKNHIIPILVRSFHVSSSALSEMQILPRDGVPIDEHRHLDSVWTEVVTEIRAVLNKIEEKIRSASDED